MHIRLALLACLLLTPLCGGCSTLLTVAYLIAPEDVPAEFKGLRGTALDIFGYTAERKMERALIGEYRQTVGSLLPKLTAENLAQAVAIASIPEDIRGYGHVKERHLAEAKALEAKLLAQFRSPQGAAMKAAAE